MADVKISELPSGSTLTGTEIIPAVQGGDTVKVTVNQIKEKVVGSGESALVDKAYVDDADAQLESDLNTSVADEKSMYPAIAYNKRVLADSGTVISKQAVIDAYKAMIDLLPNTKLLFCPHAGVRTRMSGIYSYLAKAYDMGVDGIDLTQTTEASQPFINGFIATNENKHLKSNINSVSKTISHTAISFLSTDAFSFLLSVKPNTVGSNQKINISSSSYITINSNGLTLYNGTSNILSTSYVLEVGKNSIVEFKYSNGKGLIKINGIPVITTVISGAISFDRISTQATYFDGCIYYSQIFNKYLSEFESKNAYTYLRIQYPDIEGINIGNQHWATSNYEGVVTGNGTIIPEVQDPSAWSVLTTPAWCYYNNDPVLGSVYGKLYNYNAVQEIAKNPPKGWRVPTGADFVQLSTYLGGDSVSGGKLKKEGLVYWDSPNTGATNESGFSGISSGYRRETGVFTSVGGVMAIYDNVILTSSIKYINNSNGSFSTLGNTPKYGLSLRLIRNSPVGDQTQIIKVDKFTTNIASGTANKDVSIPFGYEVRAINVKSAQALTNLQCVMYNYGGGTSQATLFTGKSVAAGAEIKFSVNVDCPVQYQDPVLRFNATGNGGDGMEINIVLNKIL